MESLEINVSFVPNLNAVLYAMLLDIPGLEKVAKIVFASKLIGRSHVVINENATGEEVQDMINWVRGVLKSAPERGNVHERYDDI